MKHEYVVKLLVDTTLRIAIINSKEGRRDKNLNKTKLYYNLHHYFSQLFRIHVTDISKLIIVISPLLPSDT